MLKSNISHFFLSASSDKKFSSCLEGYGRFLGRMYIESHMGLKQFNFCSNFDKTVIVTLAILSSTVKPLVDHVSSGGHTSPQDALLCNFTHFSINGLACNT